jgi:hypothetical protein
MSALFKPQTFIARKPSETLGSELKVAADANTGIFSIGLEMLQEGKDPMSAKEYSAEGGS